MGLQPFADAGSVEPRQRAVRIPKGLTPGPQHPVRIASAGEATTELGIGPGKHGRCGPGRSDGDPIGERDGIHGPEDRYSAGVSVDCVMYFDITVRYGGRHQRYHTYKVEAEEAREALKAAADAIPDEIAPEVDLVELRVAVDPDAREYLE